MREIHALPAPPPRAFAAHGEGTWLVPPCDVIGPEAIAIGSAVVLLEWSSLRALAADAAGAPVLVVGDRVRLGRFLTIVSEVGIHIGDAVSGSDCVTIVDTYGDAGCLGDGPGGLPLPISKPVHIGDGSYLGYGCFVGPGVRIGEGAFVGEGAVVTEDVDPFTVVYGNPARLVRRYDRAADRWEGPEWP